MGTIFNDLYEEKNISALGHELHVGDAVEFNSCGHTIIARVKEFAGEKSVCIPIGWRGEPEFRSQIKKQYKVLTRNCYLVNIL